MPHSINHVTLLGNVGSVTPFRAMTKLRIATARSIKKGDEWSEVTDWHNVVTFGRTAEYAAIKVQLGDKVAVQGKLVTSSYENKEGSKVYTTEIHCRELVNCTKRDGKVNGQGGSFSEPNDDIPF